MKIPYITWGHLFWAFGFQQMGTNVDFHSSYFNLLCVKSLWRTGFVRFLCRFSDLHTTPREEKVFHLTIVISHHVKKWISGLNNQKWDPVWSVKIIFFFLPRFYINTTPKKLKDGETSRIDLHVTYVWPCWKVSLFPVKI